MEWNPKNREIKALRQKIIVFLRGFTMNEADIEDITQETLLRMIKMKDRINPEQGIISYSFRIAANLWYDLKRKEKREFRNNKLSQTHDKDLLNPVYKAIEKLSRKEKLYTNLFYFQNFTSREIAKMEGISSSTVRNTILRAREKMKKSLLKTR